MHDDTPLALNGAGNPSAVTPEFTGQLYINTTAGTVFIANSMTAGDWSAQSMSTVNSAPKASDFSSWTWQNQGAATLDDGDLGLARMYIPGSTTNSLRHLALAVPASPYQLTVQFSYTGDTANYRHMFIGWKVALTSLAKLEVKVYNCSNPQGFGNIYYTAYYFSNEITYASEYGLRDNLVGNSTYLRIKESGGNIYTYFSENRNSWYLIESYAKGAKYLASNEYNYLVIGGNQSLVSNPFYIDINYFKLEAL